MNISDVLKGTLRTKDEFIRTDTNEHEALIRAMHDTISYLYD